MIKGIAHLAFRVTDMKKALDFYVRGLGFTHAFSIEDDENRPWIEYLKIGNGQFIELFYPGQDQQSRNESYMHVCLEVDDCLATEGELEARGIRISNRTQRGKDGNYQCWVHDPDGHAIEIMQISPDSMQAKA